MRTDDHHARRPTPLERQEEVADHGLALAPETKS
jgi:hypothetical protein